MWLVVVVSQLMPSSEYQNESPPKLHSVAIIPVGPTEIDVAEVGGKVDSVSVQDRPSVEVRTGVEIAQPSSVSVQTGR